MRIIVHALSALIFSTLVVCFFVAGASHFECSASLIYPVHNLNTGLNYTTINEAIVANETLPGDTILVEKGVYAESLIVGKQLHLVGEDRDTTIIDGNSAYQVLSIFPNATVTNFTIRHGLYGIRVHFTESLLPQYGGISIVNNRIEGALYCGVVLDKASNNTIVDNIITNNLLSGIHLSGCTNSTITNNTVANNLHGIDFYGNCRDNILRNNTMVDNAYNFGLIWYGDTFNWLLDQRWHPNIVNDIDASNTVNGKPIYCWTNRNNTQIPSDAGFVWLTDCDNVTVRNLNLSNNLEGIMLAGTTNAMIDSNNMTLNAYGIHVSIFSYNNTFVNNTLQDNGNGVYLGEYAGNTVMRNNTINGSKYNFGIPLWYPSYVGWSVPSFRAEMGFDDIDLSNMVDGKPIVWWIGKHEMKVPSNAGYVALINCTNMTVDGLSLSNNMQNILLFNSNNTLISNNLINNSVCGIWIKDLFAPSNGNWYRQPSINNSILGCTLLENGIGCKVEQGDCTILNNTLYGNPIGLSLIDINDSTIAGNTISRSSLNVTFLPPDISIFIHPLQHWQLDSELLSSGATAIALNGKSNVIYDNTIQDSDCGIISGYYGRAFENTISHNNFINNTYQAADCPQGSDNWDLGYPSGGNYWSDYTGTDTYSGPYQNETGSDRIGDTTFSGGPYVLDHYPLIEPYTDRFDIAVSDLWASTDMIIEDRQIMNVWISIINLSVETETFNVTLQTNSTTIATFQNVSLPVGKSKTMTFEWDLTGLPYGEYLINVSATSIPKENYISDNTRSLLTVHTIPGDLNRDGKVDYDDAALLGDHFGSEENQRTPISSADINGDGEVDILDAVILSNNFGRTW
jgi:parallel beta-helix repeat protein